MEGRRNVSNSRGYFYKFVQGIKKTIKRREKVHINGDVLEELFIWLPFKSLCRFKTVSKEWKSILESKRFVKRHLNLQKSGRKSLVVAYDCNCGLSMSLLPKLRRFEWGEEFVFLHYDATRPSMSCDGLICFPEAQWINVLNPLTEQLWRFRCPPLLNPLPNSNTLPISSWSTYFPGNCVMGFGRDIVNGCYKVIKISNDSNYRHILDVNTGKWRKLCVPRRCKFDLERKSAYVNGSIYWLQIESASIYNILCLDLHIEEFHDVPRPPLPNDIMFEAQIANIQDLLAIAMPVSDPVHKLDLWVMDPQEETWMWSHSICLSSLGIVESRSFTPVTLSLEGNVVFYDNKKTLFKYYPQTDQLETLSHDICVLTPYRENLVSFQTRQVKFRTGITCISRSYVSERVVEFLIKGIDFLISGKASTWLWKNQIKIFLEVLFFQILYLCTIFDIILTAKLMLFFHLTLKGYGRSMIKIIIIKKLLYFMVPLLCEFLYSFVLSVSSSALGFFRSLI